MAGTTSGLGWMAWTWQTTVTVRKGGAVVGVTQTTITSR